MIKPFFLIKEKETDECEEDKTRMLKSYTWKDLLVDGAIITVVLGIIFLIISIFL